MVLNGWHGHPGSSLCCRGPGTKRGQENQALGRSKGGFTTSIKALVDALGNPLKFVLTPGQTHDLKAATALLEGWKDMMHLLADRAFDADWFLDLLKENDIIAVIPPKKNRKVQRDYDTDLYKERHAVECFFNKVKHYRRIFSRFDKLDNSYLGFLHLAGALIWVS